MPQTDLKDVLEVQIAAPHRVRVLVAGKTEAEADGAMVMAITRRGVDKYFFVQQPAGKYRDGDFWLMPSPFS